MLHARELTYAAVVPVRALGGPRDAYRWIHERLARALASLGVPAEIAPDPERATPVDGGPCFQVAAGGEVVVGGRKLVGSAQLRVGGALLQHGSILIGDDQGMLDELGDGGTAASDRPAALDEVLGRPFVAGELEDAVLEAFGARALATPPTSSVEIEMAEHYRSEAWTWRR